MCTDLFYMFHFQSDNSIPCVRTTAYQPGLLILRHHGHDVEIVQAPSRLLEASRAEEKYIYEQ